MELDHITTKFADISLTSHNGSRQTKLTDDFASRNGEFCNIQLDWEESDKRSYLLETKDKIASKENISKWLPDEYLTKYEGNINSYWRTTYTFQDYWICSEKDEMEKEARCWLRTQIIDFLIKIGLESKMPDNIIHHAILLFDLFIQNYVISKRYEKDDYYDIFELNENLAESRSMNYAFLHAFVCLSISYKFYGSISYFDNRSVYFLFEERFDIEEISYIELNILTIIDFNVLVRTPYDFVTIIFETTRLKSYWDIKNKALYFLEIIQIDPNWRLLHPLFFALWVLELAGKEILPSSTNVVFLIAQTNSRLKTEFKDSATIFGIKASNIYRVSKELMDNAQEIKGYWRAW